MKKHVDYISRKLRSIILIILLLLGLGLAESILANAVDVHYSINWAGYAFYYNINSNSKEPLYLASAYSVIRPVSLPSNVNISGHPIALSIWVGISNEDAIVGGADANIVQGGWEAYYSDIDQRFEYYIWYQFYPEMTFYRIIATVSPGDLVYIWTWVYNQAGSTGTICLWDTQWSYSKCFTRSINVPANTMTYADFILETPYFLIGGFSILPQFSNDRSMYLSNVTVVLDNMTTLQGSWFISSHYYDVFILKPSSQVDACASYDEELERVIFWYISSIR